MVHAASIAWGVTMGLLGDFGFLFIAMRALPQKGKAAAIGQITTAIAWLGGFWAAGFVGTPATALLSGSQQAGAEEGIYLITISVLFAPMAILVIVVFWKKFSEMSGIKLWE